MSSGFFIGREIQLKKILNEIKKPHNVADVKRIIGIHGIGGAGKTTLLNKIQEKIKDERLPIVSFRVNEDVKFGCLPEFVNALAKTFSSAVADTENNFLEVDRETTLFLKISREIESPFTPDERE